MSTTTQQPIIGLPRLGTSLFRKYMQGKYVSSLERTGVKVEILEPTTDASVMASYLDRCDGFVFPGGPDIAPHLYGQEADSTCGTINEVRDNFEYSFLKIVLESQKPVLCICRGMQLLNIVLGGSLIQDIKGTQKYKHSDFLGRKKSTHPINIEMGTILFSIFSKPTILINSIHHQAVTTLGNDLICSALSPDGFVEAIELPNHPFCVGVQWHPEHMAKTSKEQLGLFQAFTSHLH